MPLTIETLVEVEKEIKRFLKRSEDAKRRLKNDESYFVSSKETGAVKRAAIDLKNELTRITQS